MPSFHIGAAPSYLGIDIGATSIKVAELKRVNGQPRLINYGFSDEMVDFSSQRTPLDVNKVATLIREICDRAGIKTVNAIAAMPSFSVFSSVLSLSNINKKDIDSAIMWEAKKVVPLDLDEMVLDWKIIEENKLTGTEKDSNKEQNKQHIKVLLTGAPKSLVNKYIEIFQGAKLNLLSLETEMFSLIRSLVGVDPSIVAVVDLGAVNTDIAIVENTLPMFSRSLDTGGIMITKAISESLQVGFRRAEQFKFDLNMSANTSGQELPKIVTETFSPIINEIKYSLNLYQQENDKKIDKVILAGGGANLAHSSDYLSKILNLNVIIGDPWARVVYPLDLKPVLDEIGSRMAIAVGLALREVD